MTQDRPSVRINQQSPWRTRWKRFVLWLYQRGLIGPKTTQKLIDWAGARLA